MTTRTTRRGLRRLTAAASLTVAAALALPAVAAAEPPADPVVAAAPAPDPLVGALETLRAQPGADALAVAAAEAIGSARGGATDVAEDSPLSAYEDAVEFLRGLGIEPFLYPTGAPFCTEGGSLPLGIAPAVAGAAPGPWPNLNIPMVGPVNAVDPGETLFAFVPMGVEKDGENTTGMQVAWFNVNTFQGGFVPMGTIAEAAALAVPGGVPEFAKPLVATAVQNFFAGAVPLGGVRAAPVATGSGTVLAAVFGTVQNGETSCFFLPTVGIVEVPA
ncbi:hypothetical protein D092_00915 [Rhodococcus ruber Chol-4]|uniref:hypothetical protein n=1 Tax=Rhodococcus ruber TaxID=1830 RepID=UPI0003457299|nr:hypothetical protein [Rhodococcus ruber]KXF87680.1 hypothetical protein D092_00915 [Rhodococcus ruber Chol-4]